MNKKFLSSVSVILSGATFLGGFASASQCSACKDDGSYNKVKKSNGEVNIVEKSKSETKNLIFVIEKKPKEPNPLKRGVKKGTKLSEIGEKFLEAGNIYIKFFYFSIGSLLGEGFGTIGEEEAFEIFMFFANKLYSRNGRTAKIFFNSFKAFLSIFYDVVKVMEAGNQSKSKKFETDEGELDFEFFKSDFSRLGIENNKVCEDGSKGGSIGSPMAKFARKCLSGVRNFFKDDKEIDDKKIDDKEIDDKEIDDKEIDAGKIYYTVDKYFQYFTGSSKNIYAQSHGAPGPDDEKKTKSNLFNRMFFTIYNLFREWQYDKNAREDYVKKIGCLYENLKSVRKNLTFELFFVLKHVMFPKEGEKYSCSVITDEVTNKKTVCLFIGYGGIGAYSLSCNNGAWSISGGCKTSCYHLDNVAIQEYMVRDLLECVKLEGKDTKTVDGVISEIKGEKTEAKQETKEGQRMSFSEVIKFLDKVYEEASNKWSNDVSETEFKPSENLNDGNKNGNVLDEKFEPKNDKTDAQNVLKDSGSVIKNKQQSINVMKLNALSGNNLGVEDKFKIGTDKNNPNEATELFKIKNGKNTFGDLMKSNLKVGLGFLADKNRENESKLNCDSGSNENELKDENGAKNDSDQLFFGKLFFGKLNGENYLSNFNFSENDDENTVKLNFEGLGMEPSNQHLFAKESDENKKNEDKRLLNKKRENSGFDTNGATGTSKTKIGKNTFGDLMKSNLKVGPGFLADKNRENENKLNLDFGSQNASGGSAGGCLHLEDDKKINAKSKNLMNNKRKRDENKNEKMDKEENNSLDVFMRRSRINDEIDSNSLYDDSHQSYDIPFFNFFNDPYLNYDSSGHFFNSSSNLYKEFYD